MDPDSDAQMGERANGKRVAFLRVFPAERCWQVGGGERENSSTGPREWLWTGIGQNSRLGFVRWP